jgi:predicted DNA-binding protein (MmcQ/YjbR family)
MDIEHTRRFLQSLPDVVESVSDNTSWGDKLVFRIGEQSIGGKMFAQIDFEQDGRAVLSFAAEPEQFSSLVEREGVAPAPYRARLYWVALNSWDAVSDKELEGLLRNARSLTFAKLPKRTRHLLSGAA